MVLVIIIGSLIVVSIVIGGVQRIFGFRFSSRLLFANIFGFTMLLAGILWSSYRDVRDVFDVKDQASNAIEQLVSGSSPAGRVNNSIEAENMTAEEQREDLLNYINNEMSAIGEIEDKLNEDTSTWSRMVLENPKKAGSAMTEIITLTKKLVEAAESIHPRTKELWDIHESYIQSANRLPQMMMASQQVLEKNDYAIIQLNELNNEIEASLRDYLLKLADYCEKNGVEFVLENRSFATFVSVDLSAVPSIDIEEIIDTTYFVDNSILDSEYKSTIILEPDGTCAYLAYDGFDMIYESGKYQVYGDKFIFNFPFGNGGVFTLYYNEDSLVYTNRESFGYIYPGATFDKSESTPKSVQLTPPYSEVDVPDGQNNNSLWQDIIHPTVEDVMNVFPQALLEYYDGYLAGINWDDPSRFRNTTPEQEVRLLDRIRSGTNAQYYFELVQIIIDMDTVAITEYSDSCTIQFYAEFQFIPESRDERIRQDSDGNVQLVDMVFYKSDGVCLVDNSQIVDGIAIGANQLVLQGE